MTITLETPVLNTGLEHGVQSFREPQIAQRDSAAWMAKANDHTKDTEAIGFNFSATL